MAMILIPKFLKMAKFYFILGIFVAVVSVSGGIPSEDNPYQHKWVVDKEGKYVLEWEVDWKADGGAQVIFNVTVETRGWVGLGLNRKGVMNGSDIVVGGVGANGKPYFSDRHGVGNSRPVLDLSQDWTLLNAWESNRHTFLSFSRKLDTCDTNDIPIPDDLLSILWAYGETDDENIYHFQNSGFIDFYLTDPDLTPKIIVEQRWKNVTTPQQFDRLGDWNVFRIKIPQVMPVQDTSYLCTMHKAPTHTKHHIVGVRPIFPTELESRHIHHLGITKCIAPTNKNANELFGPHVGAPPVECYAFLESSSVPVQYCFDTVFVYSVGGGPTFLPDHVGFSMSENGDEYYLVQVHYDNPNEAPNILLNLTLELYYTDKLRENDGGMMTVGFAPLSYSNLVPPHTLDHVGYGFCCKQCTEKILPKGGINVVGHRVHSHTACTQNRLMVIRGKDRTEEPIYIHDNYNNAFQEHRTLRDEFTIYPGDIIYQRCNYQTVNRTAATVGGYSTRNEMCHTWLQYYPYIQDYSICQSEIRSDAYREFLQIYNTTFDQERREYIVLSPPINAGLSTENAATRIHWSLDNRRQLQTHQRFLPQVSYCSSTNPDLIDERIKASAAVAPTLPPIPPNYIKINPNLLEKIDPGHSTTTFTDLDKEIRSPGNEFIYLWPSDVKWYSRPSTCPLS